MGNSEKNVKKELNFAVRNALHAQEYIKFALNTVENINNRQLIQDTLNHVNKSLDMTKTSLYGLKK